jgi:hypothetical protein
MGHDTYGDEDYGPGGHGQPEDHDRGQPEAYWRRRVIALGAGLALLALLAWAFSGGGKAPAAAPKDSQGGSASAWPAAAYSGPPAAAGSPASLSPRASGSASSASVGSAATLPFPAVTAGSGQPGRKASARAAAGGAGGGNAARGGAGGVSGVEPDGSCAPSSMVLSLFTSRTAYSAGQYPAFQVDAVSTASRTCSFDLSPHRLHVQVMSKGRVIWDSADCGRGQPNRSIRFRRGVPAETYVTWRRIVSLPGCVTVASSARPGGYQVQAKDSSVASPVRSFKLVR